MLRDLDRVAYVRFASVYRDFQDVDEFERELAQLEGRKKRARASGETNRCSVELQATKRADSMATSE